MVLELDDHFSKLDIQLHYFDTTPFSLRGFKVINQFFKEQQEKWQVISNETGGNKAEFCAKQLDHCQIKLSEFREKSYTNPQSMTDYWENEAVPTITRYLVPRNGGSVVFLTPELEDFINSFQKKPNQLNGALHYLMQLDLRHEPQGDIPKDQFIGYTKAYEFDNQTESLLVSRSKHEKAALVKVKSSWKAFLETTNSNYESFKQSIEEWRKLEQQEFADWDQTHRQEIQNLEKAYGELLHLEKPAVYWAERAKTFRTRNKWWLGFASGVTAVLLSLLVVILYYPPEAFRHSLFMGDPLAIKAIVLYISIVSFGAYLLHLFVKFSTSSLHLARDAEEREQLTHVFLALIKSEAITPEDRNIVLQALFSRADTGLLKDDSGPTMPGLSHVLDRLISR